MGGGVGVALGAGVGVDAAFTVALAEGAPPGESHDASKAIVRNGAARPSTGGNRMPAAYHDRLRGGQRVGPAMVQLITSRVVTLRAAFSGLVVAGASACGRDTRHEARAEPSPAPTQTLVATTAAPPRCPAVAVEKPSASADALPADPADLGSEAFVQLAVEGFGDAVVSVPQGTTGPRPVVVAVHGNYNRPDTLCEAWRPVFGAAFVLCPRGVPRPDSPSLADQRYTFDNTKALGDEIDRALVALRSRFGAHVDTGSLVYAGFSLGAIMGVFVTAHSPGLFPRVILVEGGTDRYVPDVLDAFAKGGGRRVLFVCAQPDCATDAPFTIARLEAAGVKAECVIGPPIGHRYDGAIAETIQGALPWVLDGDARFLENR